MIVSELKDYLQKLPKNFDTYAVTIVSEVDQLDCEMYATRHEPVYTAMVDEKNKEICFFNEENINKLDKILN